MITEIEVGNVRLFEGDGWKFPLAPLTLFCGANSAGKSSIIKTLLLMQQSQNEKQRMNVVRPLFNGDIVDLWNYKTFVSHGEENRDISIAITTESAILWEFLEKHFGVEIPEGKTPQDSTTYQIRAQFVFKNEYSDISEDEKADNYGYLDNSEYMVCVDDTECLSWSIKYERNQQDNRIPSYYSLIIPKKYKKIIRPQLPKELKKVFNSLQNETFVKIRVGLDGLFPFLFFFPETEHLENDNSNQISLGNFLPIQIIPQIFNPVNRLEDGLSSIIHIAPLRPGPQRYYSRTRNSKTLDSEGLYVPTLLHEDGNKEISYVRPNKVFQREIALIQALNDWLYYLRTGDICDDPKQLSDELNVESTNNFVIEINLRTPSGKSMYPMADSGVGLSQVLPILTRVLFEPTNSIILIEQPELHLHPALQVRLAEFFVCMSRMGKQIIVETHSEHIVNTVRVLAAEDETGEIAKNSQIHFIDIEDGKPKVHNLSIQPNGIVPNWPNSFFGEAMNLTGRLLRAQKRFRNPS